jgi:hypothetical protein
MFQAFDRASGEDDDHPTSSIGRVIVCVAICVEDVASQTT